MLEWIISSTVLTAIVIVLRFALKGRMSLRLQYALWAIVLVRLLVPISFGSTGMSVQNIVDRPAAQAPLTVDTLARDTQGGAPGSLAIGDPLRNENNPPLPENEQKVLQGLLIEPQIADESSESIREQAQAAVTTQAQPLSVTEILTIVWLSGAGMIALWFFVTNLRFWFKLRKARQLQDVDGAPLPVYVTDRIDTPCLFGLIKPKIYVTPEVAGDSAALRYSIEHEATHRRHGDHVWSLLRGLCLALHWYNPLVWVAAVLSRNDAELACDEATIRRIGEDNRAEYGRTLIQLTCEKRPALFVAATTMTGSGRSIKERIRLIVKKPKTAVITLIAIVLVIAIAVGCTFTGAKTDTPEQPTQGTDDSGNTIPIKAEQDLPADANVIGQAMYGGLLYDVPDVTTGFAFEEKQELTDAVLIPSNETPTQSLECNVPGTTASFAVRNGDLILIVDGTQYYLANRQKITATITPIGTEPPVTEPVPDETVEMTRPAPRAADRTATVTLAEEGSHTCRNCSELHHYRIPRVEIRRGEDYVSYEQVQSVNEELFNTLFEYSHYYVDVDYAWWRTDDVLTILVELKTNGGEHDGGPDTSYRVYNIDIYNGYMMSVDEMLTNAALSREEFNELATAALLNYAYSIGSFDDPQMHPPTLQERYNYQYRVVSGEYHGTYPFWGEDGRLWIVGSVATHAPGSGFVIRALPLSGYELDPQFAEDFAAYVGQTYVSTMDPEGECHTLVIPFINLPGAEIDALNEELYRFFTTDAQATDSAPVRAAEYHWYVRGDVLTLLLQQNYGSVNPKYTIYSIRISTAHVMTKKEVLAEAGLTDAEYRELASAALGNAYCVSLSDYIPRFIDTDVFLRRQFIKTIGRDNTSETVPYFGENGTLYLCGRVYQITGGGSYQEKLLPLTEYETSEYYDDMLSKIG